jgi:hypothetical protein
MSKFWRLCKYRNRTNTTDWLLDMNYYQAFRRPIERISQCFGLIVCDWLCTRLTCTKILYLHDVSHQESVGPNNLNSLQREVKFESLSILRRFYKYQENSRNWANTPHCVVDTKLLSIFRRSVVRFSDLLFGLLSAIGCERNWPAETYLHGISHQESVGLNNPKSREPLGTVASSFWTSDR